MRDRDGRQPAEVVDGCHGRVIDEADAIPEQVTGGSSDQVRLLADGDLRLSHDPGQIVGYR